jgi:hypothetical protein
MSATFSEKRSAGPDVWRLLGSRFLEVLSAWRRARGTYRALSELDDDMLHDIWTPPFRNRFSRVGSAQSREHISAPSRVNT